MYALADTKLDILFEMETLLKKLKVELRMWLSAVTWEGSL
jgi:hypothetical protein